MNDWPLLFACSGAFGELQMQRSQTFGQVSAMIGAVATLSLAWNAWRLRRFTVALALSILIMSLHPAWTVSLMRGDCTTPRVTASCYAAGAFVFLLVFQFYLSKGRGLAARL